MLSALPAFADSSPFTFGQASRIQSLYDADGALTQLYEYTGKAVVTFVEDTGDSRLIYAQDFTGAFCLNAPAETAIAQGDEITNVYARISDTDPYGLQLVLETPAEGEAFSISSTGKSKTPQEIDPATFDPAMEQYKLVVLKDAHFEDVGEFESKAYTVTVGSSEAVVYPFAGTDLIGVTIPAVSDVAGIARSAKSCEVWPRSFEDVMSDAPAVSVAFTPATDTPPEAYPINEESLLGRFTVTARNLTAPGDVYLTGPDAGMFRVSAEAIPDGSGATEVDLFFCPSQTGKFKANVIFGFDAVSSELNRSYSIGNTLAYDPEHLPALAVDPAEITLNARVGETATQSVTLTVDNAIDYVYAAKGNDEVSSVIISSTMFLPSQHENSVTISFQPKTEGDVTQTFSFTTVMGEPVTLTVHGKTTGGQEPEVTEGGELTLTPENAYDFYTQNFADVVSNKPLDLPGWCNVAEEGTRAWWGYVGDDFTAAKVTAYDSRAELGAGTPCQMLLVSPALDFAKAKSRMLKFRLMGKALMENMTDKLNICLVELIEGEPVISPMSGFDVPVTPDLDGTWLDYNVDMSVIPDMPDVFWIGFRFTSTRGRENSAQYYITDFVWGDPAGSVEGVTAADNTPEGVYNLQGIKVLEKASMEQLRALPQGIYIVNGRKVRL